MVISEEVSCPMTLSDLGGERITGAGKADLTLHDLDLVHGGRCAKPIVTLMLIKAFLRG